MSAPVFCASCDHVHPASRDAEKPWNWRCLTRPRAPGFGFVHPTFSPDPPYGRCRSKNYDGNCPDFAPLPGTVVEARA